MNISRILVGALFVLLLTACTSSESEDAGKQTQQIQPAQSPAERALALDQGPRAATTWKLDSEEANRGKLLFEGRSCSDCHTLGETDIAPDLLGVLDRRTHQWLMKQITQPEWMNQNDPITKGLIAEFGLEMIGTEVSEADAEAILHFLWRESEKTAP